MPEYPIWEVNGQRGTLLRGGTYDPDTGRIDPAGGTDPRAWEQNVLVGERVHVIYETEQEREAASLDLQLVDVQGTQARAQGTEAQRLATDCGAS